MGNDNQTEVYETDKHIISLHITEDEKEKEKNYRINDIFSTALIQLIMTGLYCCGYKVIEMLDEMMGFGNDVVAPLLYLVIYIVYLAGIVIACNKVIGKERRGYASGALAALFEIHLLFNAVYYIALGVLDSETIVWSLSVLVLTLYFGFSVSLADLFDARKQSDFWYCFIKSYCDAGITKLDILHIVLIDSVVLGASVFFYSRPIVLLAIIVFLLLLACAYDKRRKHQQELFGKKVTDIISKFNHVLIWKVGMGTSIFEHLTEMLKQSESCVALEDRTTVYDCVIIISDLPKRKGYPRYLTELRQILKPNGLIIDSAIVRRKKLRRKAGFSWLRIPTPEPIALKIEEYESIFVSWK